MASEYVMADQSRSRSLDTTIRPAFKNILFATDLSSAAEKGLWYAVEIARRYGAILHVIHVVGPPVYPYAPAAAWPKLAEEDKTFELEAKAKLEEQLQPVPHELIFQEGEVSPTLSDLIRAKQADLLVLGTHGRSGIEKALMGSVAEKIFHQAACPVLTVGPKVTARSRYAAELNRILYATDFSPESLAAAPYALSLAQEHRAQLILLNCLEDGAEAVHAMLQTLGRLVPFGADLRCEPICIVERGPHGENILDVSEGHGADLIVLGIACGPVKAHFHRSALYKIATQATCPVLTVRA
jgi:nucleotide-binding universal stress UspA family protein